MLDFFSRNMTNPRLHRAVYRLTRGRVGARLPMVKPGVLLLTTTGRRSGESHTTPLVFFRDGETFAVAATNGGTGKVPAWLLNLRHDPAVKVRVGAVEMKAVASEVTDAERDRLWDQMVDEHPLFSLYEQRAPVAISVVVLNPQSGESTERNA